MKNSQLALKVFIGLIVLIGLISIWKILPIVLLFMGIFSIAIYIVVCFVDSTQNYQAFGKKCNMLYYISKFLDSFPQIIKDKKK